MSYRIVSFAVARALGCYEAPSSSTMP